MCTILSLALLLLIYAWGVVFLWSFDRLDFVCDDAFISFRYARNLANGYGLRFNLDENPPVEGFSNLLWVVMLSGVEAVRLDPTFVSRAISVSCGVMLVMLLFRHLRIRQACSVWVSAAAGLFFVTLPPVAVWSTSGLETLPFALLVFLVFDRLTVIESSPRVLSAGLAGLGLVLIRTDGFAWALVAGLVGAVAVGSEDRSKRLRAMGPYFAVVLAGMTGLTVWRLVYFGEWTANTTYVKLGFSGFALLRGWNYAVSFVLTILSVGVVLLAAAPLLLGIRRGPMLACAMMIAATFTSTIMVSGDFMPFFRLFVVGTPYFAILLALVLERLWVRGTRSRMAVILLTAACVTLSILPARDRTPIPESIRGRFRYRFAFFRPESGSHPPSEMEALRRSIENFTEWARLGKALGLVCRPQDTLVAAAIGAVGYYSQMQLLDMGGLTDREVARRPPAPGPHSAGHDKVVPISYFEKYQPRYAYAALSRRGPALAGDLRLLPAIFLDRPGERHLLAVYAPQVFSLPAGSGFEPDEVLVLGERVAP